MFGEPRIIRGNLAQHTETGRRVADVGRARRFAPDLCRIALVAPREAADRRVRGSRRSRWLRRSRRSRSRRCRRRRRGRSASPENASDRRRVLEAVVARVRAEVAAAAAGRDDDRLRDVQPFLLRRQAVVLAGLARQPVGVGLRILPADADDRMIAGLLEARRVPAEFREAREQALRFAAARRRSAGRLGEALVVARASRR